MGMTTPTSILTFWFGDPNVEDTSYAARRGFWFGKHPEMDRTIRDRFLSLYEQAVAGELEEWRTSAQGCLALIVLLDQFPRNMFRGEARAFAADGLAREITQWAIAQGWDQQLTPEQRIFVYLPLEHSEQLADQQQCLEVMGKLAETYPELADTLDYSRRHLEVIDRFGRFPHRNAALGRESTPEEVEFLKQPGSSF
jgi:uncharacterized protein (DUF924 family)